MEMISLIRIGLAAVVCCFAVSLGIAQQFPTRPLTLVVPFAPGGATDIVARLLAVRVGEDLGQSVVVENRPGGAGNTGTAAVARAAPDGYTMVLATTTQLINQFLSKNLSYNLFTDLVPVALIADAPEVLAVTGKLPVTTVAEFVAAAKAKAGGFSYGSAGTGSVPHLGGELLARTISAPMVHVPFRGTADSMRELVAGNIEFTFTTQASVASFLGAGQVRILVVAAPKRLSTLPDIPTTAEAGIPNVELSNWFGIMAPRGTSSELVSRLNTAFNKALSHQDTTRVLTNQGIEPVRETPAYFSKRLQEDATTYKAVVEQIGLTPQ
jgi:tripartite-type tricarboxylate transporter receptor subunit TctC